MMRWQLTTRAEFERLVRTDPETLTDFERAARFYYLQRTAFGGKVSGRTFGTSVQRPALLDRPTSTGSRRISLTQRSETLRLGRPPLFQIRSAAARRCFA